MMNFSVRKIILVVGVCLIGLLFAVPNFLPPKVLSSLPSFIPSKTVNLGLDLRGGSHLLLEVDVNAVAALIPLTGDKGKWVSLLISKSRRT